MTGITMPMKAFGWQLFGWPKNEKLMAFPYGEWKVIDAFWSVGCPNRNCGLNG